MPVQARGFLGEALQYAVARVARDRRAMSLPSRSRPLRSLVRAVRVANELGSVALVAEYKRSTPTGRLQPRLSPEAYARVAVEAGACAVSVVVEPRWFGGNYGDVSRVAGAVDAPILFKDFVVDPWQVEAAFALGADAILVMADALTDRELAWLTAKAGEVGLEVLVEVRDALGIQRATRSGAQLVGVNARDLSTLDVDLGVPARLLKLIPPTFTRVAESGVRKADDVALLAKAGAQAVLVGTALVGSVELAEAVRGLASVRLPGG